MTHTAKHTPGPWESVYMKLLERKRALAKIEHLTEVQQSGLMQVNKELDAHYALREAAPAMYEALYKLMLEAIHYRNTGAGEQFLTLAIEQAQNALAQAEGR